MFYLFSLFLVVTLYVVLHLRRYIYHFWWECLVIDSPSDTTLCTSVEVRFTRSLYYVNEPF